MKIAKEIIKLIEEVLKLDASYEYKLSKIQEFASDIEIIENDVYNYSETLLIHLLKLTCFPTNNPSNVWKRTIAKCMGDICSSYLRKMKKFPSKKQVLNWMRFICNDKKSSERMIKRTNKDLKNYNQVLPIKSLDVILLWENFINVFSSVYKNEKDYTTTDVDKIIDQLKAGKND